MRSLLVAFLVSAAIGCSGGKGTGDDQPSPPCSDGEDNDGDGLIDFPDDLGCTSESDDTEDSLTSPKCMDGRDNDGDGRTDYPSDPGCFAPQADDETDDCPTGPNCPACGDGIDNDDSGAIDYPNDPGCTSASDDEEFLANPVACGAGLMVLPLPTTGMAMGEFDQTSKSTIVSPCGGGGGAPAYAYRINLSTPRVVEVSTDDALTTANTLIDIRSEMCAMPDAHLACNDDISSTNLKSKVTQSLLAGTYYIIVSGADSSASGTFAVQVKTYAGEGTTCAAEGDCGPGLVCRIPMGGTGMLCSPPRCDDADDEDADGHAGYPDDPGCTSPDDNDETDDCPNGPNCPECGDTVDNDTDGTSDYPADLTCQAAGDASEACVSSEGVQLITGPMTMGDTTGATNDTMPTCASTSSHTAGDRMFRLDVPGLSSLDLNLTASFDTASALYGASCTGAAIKCSDPLTMNVPNLAAGTYYFVVDGWSSGSGPFTITMNGRIENGQSCESPLVAAGALACGTGYACKGATGAKTCQPALCGDGVDNDADGKIDYPFDPGCTSVADDTEENPTPLPVCANGVDDDGDTQVDWPADYGCTAASATSEAFCMVETDMTSLLTTSTATGTTAGLTNNIAPACSSSSTAAERVYALSLPVPVQSLVINTDGSAFDTVLHVRDASCGMSLACDDDGGLSVQSQVTMTNVAPGNYAVVVDGFSANTGMYTLNVKGTVAPMTACSSPLFSGGATAMLVCPTATTCTGSPLRCQ